MSAGRPPQGSPPPAAHAGDASAPPRAAGLRLTHLEKVLWPPAPSPVPAPSAAAPARPPAYTKGDYLNYLRAVADHLLPHLRGRPLVLTRYPHGALGPSFYQKNLPDGAPPWLPSFRYTHAGGRAVDYLVPESLADLLWVGQQDALEFHPWLSRCADPERPDRAVVDLDPMPPAGFEDARAVAAVVRDLLDRAGVAAWPKTSGATGIHFFIPIRPGPTHREVAEVMRGVGELLVRLWPERVTLERRVDRRAGRVYFDYLQNARGKTLCGPYSPRPRPGAPVSTPLAWEELPTVRPQAFDLAAVARRLAAGRDPFASLAEAPPQDLRALADLRPAPGGARVPSTR